MILPRSPFAQLGSSLLLTRRSMSLHFLGCCGRYGGIRASLIGNGGACRLLVLRFDARASLIEPFADLLFYLCTQTFNACHRVTVLIVKLFAQLTEACLRRAHSRKDILNAKHYAHHLGVDMPLTDVVLMVMDWMNDNGHIDEDQIAMVKYYEDKMDVHVGSDDN